VKKLNNTQKALKRMIRDTESKITDEELFLSSAFQKYQTSLAKAATGRSRYGLQVLMEWDSSENADIAYTDNYRIHCNAANSITQSFPSRFLRSQSLTGLTGHEIGHLRYSDFASLQLYLTNMENGSFYPEAPDNLPSGYKANLQDILDAMEEKDNATCLTLSRCAAQFNNILEDIYIEARMCEEYPGTFKQGIQINNLRMSELIPSIQEQIDCGYQPFSIMSNLILSYCRTGNINNRTNYSGEYTDTLSDCMDYIDDALIATQGKERLRASNYLLVLCWNYIQPMVELTRESLKKQDSTQVGDALEDLLRKESGSGSPLPTGKNGGIPKNIPGPTVKSKTPITCDLSGLDPNYRQDAINQAEKVLQEEGGRIELAKTTAVLDGNNPGITYASQYAGSGYENAANDLALYDRLRYTSYNSYAQLHAKGEFEENGHKVHSLIGISIQDYSSGTGDKNIITRFHLAPEQIQFLLSRVTAGFPEFEWSQSKIFGVPDGNGYSTAQQFFISRHVYNNQQEILTSPWRIQINNGKGIKKKNHNGGTYMQAQSFISEKSAFIQLTDMDFYMLLKRADSYIVNWENYVASFLIQNGKQQFKKQQDARMAQNIQPHEMSSYMQEQPQEQYLNGMYVA
jgi:hypothetical protein